MIKLEDVLKILPGHTYVEVYDEQSLLIVASVKTLLDLKYWLNEKEVIALEMHHNRPYITIKR